jgi:drug/metabolite transporter (DMT)-like permease
VLVFVTLLWGVSFPLAKDWQDAAGGCPGGPLLSSLTLIALRMLAALVLLVAVRPRLLRDASCRAHVTGVLIGSSFVVGFTLQLVGLAWTTPARSAFITSLGSAWTPLLAWACLRIPVSRPALVGLLLGILGSAVLAFKNGPDLGAEWAVGRGEVLTLFASIVFAVQILLLDRLGRRAEPAHLSVAFLATGGIVALLAAIAMAAGGTGVGPWLDWTASMLRDRTMLIELVVLIVFPTVLAFHLMNVYQPRVAASRAALIYLLEPLFGAAFSVPRGQDELTAGLVLGGALILGGNILVELPIWRRAPLSAKPQAES